MKTVNFILVFSFISNFAFSQKILEDLRSYDYKKVEHIIRDSIWPKPEVGQDCKFYDEKETANISFKIIPVCKFQKDSFTYISNTSILNYLEVDTSSVYAFVLYNDTLVGSLEGYQTKALPAKLKMDSAGNLLIPSPSDTRYGESFRWESSGGRCNICLYGNAYIFEKKLYSFLEKENVKLYFFHFAFSGLFYIKEDKLMAFSIADDKIYQEKELIKGIAKREYKKGEMIIGAAKHSTIGNKDIYYVFEFNY